MSVSPQQAAVKANERIRGRFPGLVGMQFLEVSPDRVLAALEVREEVKQPWGILHGGAIATLLDTAAGAGAVANLERGQQSVTVEIKVNFIGSVRAGRVTVEAVPLHRGRSTTVRCEIWATVQTEPHSPRGEFERGGGLPLSVGAAGRAPRLPACPEPVEGCKRGSLPRERSVAGGR